MNETVGAFLISLAVIYNENFPNSPTIRYNDISLPNGGLFDISGGWRPSHSLHRIGQNVDVRTNPPRSDGISLSMQRRITEMVLDIDPNATVEEHGRVRTDDEGNEYDSRHFHIDFETFNYN